MTTDGEDVDQVEEQLQRRDVPACPIAGRLHDRSPRFPNGDGVATARSVQKPICFTIN
jgi:hypothetical protein